MKVKSESEVAQLCPTPSDPKDCNPPGPSVWLSDGVWVACPRVRLEHTTVGVKPQGAVGLPAEQIGPSLEQL